MEKLRRVLLVAQPEIDPESVFGPGRFLASFMFPFIGRKGGMARGSNYVDAVHELPMIDD